MKYLSSMPSWLKIATWFLIASLATFSFKKPLLFWQNVNINDLFLLISFVCFVIAVIKNQLSITLPKKALWGFGIAMTSMIIGTLVSKITIGMIAPDALREYARILAGFVICLEVYVIGIQDRSFFEKAFLALIASSFLLPFIFYISGSHLPFFLDESTTRFTGFLFDPNYYASLQLLPTFILLWITTMRPYPKAIWFSVISFLLFALSVSSIIWSGSRGGILGLAAALGTTLLFFFVKLPIKRAVLVTTITLLGCFGAYLFMPHIAKSHITMRFQGIAEKAPISTITPSEIFTPSLIIKPSFTAKFTGRQGRGAIWKSAFHEFVKNPLGYGPDYGPTADVTGANNDHHRAAHNTLFQIVLSGGIILLVTIFVFMFLFTKKVLTSHAPLGEMHFLFASLVGVVIAGFFLDSLWSRWVWITIGLILVYLHYEEMA